MDRRAFLVSAATTLSSVWLHDARASLLAADSTFTLSSSDIALLDDLQRAAYLYFWEQGHSKTGLIKDRARAGGNDDHTVASIAATGFGLTALAIAHSRGFADKKKIEGRIGATLAYLAAKLHHERGFFFHFVDAGSGERVWKCELSSIDTSLLLCGVLTCRAYFEDAQIKSLATAIYERVDWPWMLNGATTFSMGWKPESGFLAARWNTYSELMMIYLLALGSPTHTVAAETWSAWKRTWFEFQGIRFISTEAPLFIHQYSHAWFDLRHKQDAFADYFENSIKATRAHMLFCQKAAERFKDYNQNLWGITSSDSAHGYVAWGGPPVMGPIDGSVVPCATAGSLPFLPQACLAVLHNIRKNFRSAWQRYGFVDAFNPLTNWYDEDVLGIDQGISMLMAENLRSGFVWQTFMKNPEAKAGMAKAGFKPLT